MLSFVEKMCPAFGMNLCPFPPGSRNETQSPVIIFLKVEESPVLPQFGISLSELRMQWRREASLKSAELLPLGADHSVGFWERTRALNAESYRGNIDSTMS